MIKSIIVEDDPIYSSKLAYLLNICNIPVQVVSISSTVDEAIDAINAYNPELIFLDIELDGGKTGFDLLQAVTQTNFGVIFTSAHIDNNIQNIRICGISYIVKPYILEELYDALNKYLTYFNINIEREKVSALKSNIATDNILKNTIWVSDKGTYHQVQIDQILYCESDNQYTKFYILSTTNATKKMTSSYGLGQWEDDLKKYNFCRINRNYLVNVAHIDKFQKTEDCVIISTGIVLGTSHRGKEELLKMIKK